jgi:hypothetical protein
MWNLFSWLPAEDLVPAKGRAIDHVGFEQFTKKLEGKWIKLAEPSIELTEKLRDLP